MPCNLCTSKADVAKLSVKLLIWMKNKCKNIFEVEFLNLAKNIIARNKAEKKFLNAFLFCFILSLALNFLENRENFVSIT